MKGKIHVLVELNANYIKVYCLKIYFIPKICDVYDFVALLLLQTKCVSSFMIYVLSNFFFINPCTNYLGNNSSIFSRNSVLDASDFLESIEINHLLFFMLHTLNC